MIWNRNTDFDDQVTHVTFWVVYPFFSLATTLYEETACEGRSMYLLGNNDENGKFKWLFDNNETYEWFDGTRDKSLILQPNTSLKLIC